MAALGLALIPVLSCLQGPAPAGGSLTISWELHAPADQQPSYQTAIWLEDAQGDFVATLFVSEYLAYGGHQLDGVCPDWSRASAWDEVDEVTFDAVTGATPGLGRRQLSVDCGDRGPAPGRYRYCVQTHRVGADNDLYRGEIVVGSEVDESTAELVPTTTASPDADPVLRMVAARYDPAWRPELSP